MTARDPRWVLLVETGEYSTLGRHREPDTSDIEEAEIALTRLGTAGWLAIMSHSIHGPALPELVMVRPLGNPARTFAEAVFAFSERSRAAHAS